MSTTTREISNYDDVIDSRDVIARIEHLESTVTEYAELAGDDLRDEELSDDERQQLDDLRAQVEDEAAELAALRNLAEQGENVADWVYGAVLIRDSYFTEYAEELAEDIGAIDREAGWPFTHIDWEAAARDLQTDYTQVEFDGITYWVR